MGKITFLTVFLSFAFVSTSAVADSIDCNPSDLKVLRQQAKAIAENTSIDDELGPLLKNADGQNDQWKGVGAMTGAPMTCTVNLIEPPGGCEPADDAPALIATNGHCIGLATKSPNVQRDQEFSADISFNHFQDSKEKHIKAKADRIVYGNMQSKDIAILRLNMTYGELKKKGVQPFKIAKKFEDGRVRNIAVPADGVPIEQRYIRGNECASEDRMDVLEGHFLWKKQISFYCPAVGGSSGSGLFNEKSGELMGLLNTGIKEKETGLPCRHNGPCAVDETGIKVHPDIRYGFDLTFLHDCATKTCEINPELASCPLPGSPQVIPQIGSPTNSLDGPFNLENPVTGRNFKAYQVKIGPAATTDCSDPSGYTTVTDFRYKPPKANRPEGAYVVCSFGQKQDGTWQKPKDATGRGVRLDKTPPIAKLSPLGKNGNILSVTGSESSDPIKGFQYKFANKESDCQSERDYKNPPIQWGGKSVSTETGKGKYLCVVAFDMAGNKQSSGTSYYIKP